MFVVKRIFLFSLLLVCASKVYALSLEEALVAVYKDSPILQANREKLKVADEQIMAALSRWLPQASISFIKQYSQQVDPTAYVLTSQGRIATDTLPNVSIDGSTSRLVIGQNIYRSGADVAYIRSARSSIKAAEAQLVAGEQALFSDVVNVYMGALQYYEFYKIAQEEESDVAKTLAGYRQKVAVGINTKTDLAQVEANFARAQAESIISKANYESAKAQLESLVGFKVNTLSMPNDTLSLPNSMVNTIDSALVSNPNMSYVKYSAEAAKLGVDVAKGEVLPQVNLNYQIDDNSKYKNLLVPKRSYSTQISLTIPIMNVGGWSKLREQKRQAAYFTNTLQSTRDNIRASATAAWVAFEANKARVRASKNAYEAMKLAYSGKKAAEKVGLVSVFEMVEIRKTYFNAYNAFIASKAEYYKSMYNLKAIIGECTAKGLKLNVKLYDPLKNYNSIKWQVLGAF